MDTIYNVETEYYVGEDNVLTDESGEPLTDDFDEELIISEGSPIEKQPIGIIVN